MEELRWDPEMNKAVMFGEFASHYGYELTEKEKLELWQVCQIIPSSSIGDIAVEVVAVDTEASSLPMANSIALSCEMSAHSLVMAEF